MPDNVCCTRTPYHVFDRETGETYKLRCKSYSCEVCGPKKARRLWHAMKRNLSSWQKVRMNTLTIAYNMNFTYEQHYKLVSEAFRYYIQSLKRYFKKQNKQFLYIRINEAFKSGYVHLHVFMNQYVHYLHLRRVWYNCVRLVLQKWNIDPNAFNNSEHYCSSHIKAMPVKQAVNYACKYVLKSSGKRGFFRILYSKSRIIVFFGSQKQTRTDNNRFILYKSEIELFTLLVSLEQTITEINILELFPLKKE